MLSQALAWPAYLTKPLIASIPGRNPSGGYRRANRLSCRFVLLVFFAPVGTCSLNQSYGYAFGRRRPLAQKIRRNHRIAW